MNTTTERETAWIAEEAARAEYIAHPTEANHRAAHDAMRYTNSLYR